jgi:RNA polymerase sigma-70 factor (ECF subfamily)
MSYANATVREAAGPASVMVGVSKSVPDFDELYETYADFVWRNARRLGVSLATLDDVVQDVFLVAHRKLGEVTQPESLRAWMFSIVIRVVRDHRRQSRRKDPRERATAPTLDPDEVADPGMGGPAHRAERSDAVRLLYRVLLDLDDAKREVFVLSELEEMTEAEIAEVLGENKNTVHSRLRAARSQFEEAVLRHRSRDEWRLR